MNQIYIIPGYKVLQMVSFHCDIEGIIYFILLSFYYLPLPFMVCFNESWYAILHMRIINLTVALLAHYAFCINYGLPFLHRSPPGLFLLSLVLLAVVASLLTYLHVSLTTPLSISYDCL